MSEDIHTRVILADITDCLNSADMFQQQTEIYKLFGRCKEHIAIKEKKLDQAQSRIAELEAQLKSAREVIGFYGKAPCHPKIDEVAPNWRRKALEWLDDTKGD